MGSFLLNPYLYSSLIQAFGGDNVFYTEDSESGYFTHLFTSTGGSNFIIEKGSDILEYIALGGGGGGGGKDSTINGGSGGSGAGVYGKFLATFNKTINAYVAGGGIQGNSSAATAAGGNGGIGYASGGKGGNAGSTGTSGGGGGGGGSSAIVYDSTIIGVAAGAGGGGGASEGVQNEQLAGGGGYQPMGANTTQNGAVGFNYSGDGGGGGGGGAGYLYGGLGQASTVARGASGGQSYNNTGVIIESTIYNGTNGASNSTATTAAVSIPESSNFGFTNTYGTGGATTAAGGSGIVGLKYKTNKLGIVTSGLQLYLDASIKQSFTLLPKFRYIRWTSYGNTVNASNHFCELQVLSNTGVNRASGKVATVVSGTVVSGTGSIITDGNLATTSYWDFNSASATVQVDLGSIYDDVQNVKFWNYYGDTRSYYNVTISISEDGVNFYNIYGPKTTQTVAAGISVNGIWRDLSGSGFNTTLTNSPNYNFNGIFSFIPTIAGSNFVNSFSRTGANNTTCEVWIKWGGTNRAASFAYVGSESSTGMGFYINDGTNTGTAGNKVVIIYGGSYYSALDTGTTFATLSNGIWTHLTLTRDTTTTKLYQNGVFLGSTTRVPNGNTGSTAWDSNTPVETFGSFKLYNRALSDSEILQNFNAQKSKYGL